MENTVKKTIILLGVVLVSACVGHPITIGKFYQCGEIPPSFVDERGQNVTKLSNLTISKIVGSFPVGRASYAIFYRGFPSKSTVVDDQENFFRYQFYNEEGELLEISGHPTDGPIFLGHPNGNKPLLKCTNVPFDRSL
mgnify:CR=1 FL=1